MDNQLIPAGGQFPVNASELRLVKYAAVGTLNRTEKEEAAVRLLMFSQQSGEFVGVPWNVVMLQWINEAKEYAKQDEVYNKRYNQFQSELTEYYKQRKAYIRFAWKTLGISLLFTKHPFMPMFVAPSQPTSVPQSVTLMLGRNPQDLINAFWELINEGLIRKENHNEVDYLIPTPALVSRITRP